MHQQAEQQEVLEVPKEGELATKDRSMEQREGEVIHDAFKAAAKPLLPDLHRLSDLTQRRFIHPENDDDSSCCSRSYWRTLGSLSTAKPQGKVKRPSKRGKPLQTRRGAYAEGTKRNTSSNEYIDWHKYSV